MCRLLCLSLSGILHDYAVTEGHRELLWSGPCLPHSELEPWYRQGSQFHQWTLSLAWINMVKANRIPTFGVSGETDAEWKTYNQCRHFPRGAAFVSTNSVRRRGMSNGNYESFRPIIFHNFSYRCHHSQSDSGKHSFGSTACYSCIALQP